MDILTAVRSYFGNGGNRILRAMIIITGFVFILASLSFWLKPTLPTRPAARKFSQAGFPVHHQEKDLLSTGLRKAFSTLIPAIDAPSIEHIEGESYRLEDEPIWTAPLGDRLCFVDIDNRPWDGNGQLFSSDPFAWTHFDSREAGVFNHYMYALIHGYTYHYVRHRGWGAERSGTWTKIKSMAELLYADKCRFVVVMDSDAVIMNLHLPFEWLLNRWRVRQNTSMTMPKDPDDRVNWDSKGRVNTNTGFMIAQNLPTTHEIIHEIATCPDNTEKYPGCDRFKFAWPHEQGVYSDYVRYEFPDSVQEIGCSEANGYPDVRGCEGIFVRHMWGRKDERLKTLVSAVLTAPFTNILHRNMMNSTGEIVLYNNQR